MPQSSRIDELVAEWLRYDKGSIENFLNPETRSEIEHLWDDGEWDELEARLGQRIEFGTAGLRAKMQAGYSSMNDLIIIPHLSKLPDAQKRGVVVGHDHRHNSKKWAGLTTRAFLSRGFKVYSYRGVVHTPLVPFGIKKLGAVGGVMVTASHNPAQDNGWKVYYENAVQIIPPVDSEISQSILDNLEPEDEAWSYETVREHPLCEDKTNNMRYEYHNHVAALFPPEEPADLAITHTSFHGSADLSIARAFAVTGLPPLMTVRQQRDPDPDFPTLPFPNPEEKGALTLAIETANNNGSQYILANDPDSDRFLAAEKVDRNKWHIYTGDEIGAILASYIIEEYKNNGRAMDKMAMVASTVSSKMLGAMAKAEGFHFEDTLTGFKYIGNKAIELEKQGYSVELLYEEAIGFGVSPYIRDKDGITAAIAFVRLAARLQKRNTSIYAQLQNLYKKYGHFGTRNDYFKCSSNSLKDQVFRNLRENKTENGYPVQLGSFKVSNVRDLTEGHAYDSQQASNKPILPVSAGNMITFYGDKETGETFVLTIRTSGTEPKIKYYLEVSSSDRSTIEPLLIEAEKALSEDWVKVQELGL
ncbi:Phosphoglucomutase, first 3 domain-containing protein [Wallemia mellicola CBS 633.66]|uniref:Phosphoglucomutase, first 3 domain-containing protein n=1 Tax=Wallemia mellicola (strain ATCC MYA-4683 / CBS 633.66) TaxID=671144 RepID=I4YE09_WALMC|nr:Phosphoglucomutase, first 3 domain-containing protein [Wallemia mellicola CBS 633.66]EIM22201.1 Phosphoglucomutase, first 3 domain-containing protein [Wallemia mellicola CBS 633.66]|eukprot:XP_006957996.1 Phosphoglucomutase, first 3 domain-containing protein [Wallemia mellicola CBS 633.66]